MGRVERVAKKKPTIQRKPLRRRLFELLGALPWPPLFVLAVVIMVAVWRYLFPLYGATVVVAAGTPDGESYQVLSVLKDLLKEENPRLEVVVRRTLGTDESLELLRRGEVQLAAAQADVAYNEWLGRRRVSSKTSARPPLRDIGVIAVMHVDKVHLLTCIPTSSAVLTAESVFTTTIGRRKNVNVYLPYREGSPSGGQYRTFAAIAEEFGANVDEAFTFVDDKQPFNTPRCSSAEAGNMIFRVRADGNDGVREALARHWSLVEFPHRGSLLLRNRAFEGDIIRNGTFRIHRVGQATIPIPDHDVPTLSVRRLLIGTTRGELPNWLVEKIAKTLNENGPELARAAGEGAADRDPASTDVDAQSVVSRLLISVGGNNTRDRLNSLGLPIHPAVVDYYDPRLSYLNWLNEHAEAFGLLVTVASLIALFWRLIRARLASSAKESADLFVQMAMLLMNANPVDESHDLPKPFWNSARRGGVNVDDVRATISRLKAHFNVLTRAPARGEAQKVPADVKPMVERLCYAQIRLVALDRVFVEAGRALRSETISQESFRTFEQAYNSTQDAIETQAEHARRQISLHFINRFTNPGVEGVTTDHPDVVLTEASAVLLDPQIFSRESFRTLTEAYSVAKAMQTSFDPPTL